MGKLDQLLNRVGGNVGESMGAGRVAGMVHGAPPSPAGGIPERLKGVVKAKDAAEIPVDRITPDPDQPREAFDEEALGLLAESLKSRGQLQPIRVRWNEAAGSYIIIAGERRWRAAVKAGIRTMACVIQEGEMPVQELRAIQLVENLLREDLRPIEQAKSFRALMDLNGWSARQVGRELAIDHTRVVRALALLELPAEIQEHVEQGTLAPATAHEIGKAEDPETIRAVAAEVVASGLSRAETVERVREATAKRTTSKPKGKAQAKRPKPLKSRVIRTPSGKVTIDLRKAGDADAILATLEEAVAMLKAEQGGVSTEAA